MALAGLPAAADFRKLLDHYRATRRDLPWRRSQDPYALLVSELMLQQTRVDTVLRFYERFLERFPTLASLAEAPEEEVLGAWAGLGYYRRARLLQRAARHLRETGFPRSEQELRAIPGVGEYTAASLASIAFGQPAVALDGNAIRVLARYFGEEGDPTRSSTRQRLKTQTLPHIPARQAGDFTQAVMELGATLCAPRPRCEACPLSGGCQARAQGRQSELPPRRRYPQPVEVRRSLVRVERAGRLLLISEPQAPILQGFWQCPYWEDESFRDYFEDLETLGQVRHSITHRRLTMTVHRAGPPRLPLPWSAQRWVANLAEVPVPAFMQRVLRL